MQQPTATFYAACAADNLVSELYNSPIGENGNLTLANTAITEPDNPRVYAQTVSTAASAYDCCVQCITSDDCGGGYFVNDGTGTCVVANPQPEECDPTAQDVGTDTLGDLQTSPAVTVFDGDCGQVMQFMTWDG